MMDIFSKADATTLLVEQTVTHTFTSTYMLDDLLAQQQAAQDKKDDNGAYWDAELARIAALIAQCTKLDIKQAADVVVDAVVSDQVLDAQG